MKSDIYTFFLEENTASQLSEPMSIKLCHQSVISHHVFDQRSQWRATALESDTAASPSQEFLAHVSMTSEQGGHNADH